MKQYDSQEQPSRTILGFIFVLLAIVIAIAGLLSYRHFAESFRGQVQSQLTTIASVKAAELQNWRSTRLTVDAEIVHQNPTFASLVQRYLGSPRDPWVRQQIQIWLNSYRAYPEYDTVRLLDTAGQTLVSLTGELTPVSSAVARHIPAVVQSKQVTLVDFYRSDSEQAVFLTTLIPILGTGAGNPVIGLVALRINPHVQLYSSIQQWPVPRTSAESLLVRRDADGMLVVTEPRFQPDAVLTLHYPLTATDDPGVKAALGHTGIVQGVDYRNQPVLADVRPVPDSPWFLVTKIDVAEAYAPLPERLWQTLLFSGALIFAVGIGLVLIWRQQDLNYYRRQVQTTEMLRVSAERFQVMFEHHGAIMVLIEPRTGRILDANHAAVHFYGYSRSQLCAMTMSQMTLLPREEMMDIYQKAMAGEQNYFICSHTLANGSERIVEIHASPVSLQERFMLFAIIHDITERRQAEDAVRQSEQLYRTLIQTLDVSLCRWLPDTTLVFANDKYCRIFGIQGDPLGQQWLNFLPEASRADTATFYQELANNPHTVSYEHPVTVEDGSERHFRWIDTPILDATGHLLEFQSVGIDIHERKQAEQDVLELNQTLEERVQQRTAEVQDLYELAPIGYHALDAMGKITMVNQTLLRWLGYTRDEMVGHSAVDFIPPESLEQFQASFVAFQEDGLARDLEFDLLRKDGSILPVLISGTAVYDESGTYVMSRSAVFDNSERKQAELALRESEAQNRLLFEEAPDAVVLFDRTGRMVRLNRAFESMTGYAATYLTGQRLQDLGLLSTQDAAHLTATAEQAFQADSFDTTEFKLICSDGTSRDVGMRGFGVSIQGERYYLTTIRDITTEKQAAETLRRANDELARAARAKDEFLASMSHELRTPLNAILSFSESLLDEIRGPLNERQQAALQAIDSSGRHLLALINDILDLSKVEAGRLDLQLAPVPVGEICQASLMMVKELAVQKDLTLTVQVEDDVTTMVADVRRLKQMLVNLLSNAVKFTPSGGSVRLEVTANSAANMISCAGQDTGIGIAPDDLPRLFQPFSQLDSRLSRMYEGTGLGLALVRRLVELHGGRVTVESTVGQGSCFTLALPYHRPETVIEPDIVRLPAPVSAPIQPSRTSEAGHSLADMEDTSSLTSSDIRTGTGQLLTEQLFPGDHAMAHARILLAEDNECNIVATDDYLQARGYQVVVAHTGREALDQACAIRPDVILMDIQMPEMDGLEAIRCLRTMPDFAATPIIALTALAMPGDRQRCLDAGASAYITKPVSLKGLVEVIERLLAP